MEHILQFGINIDDEAIKRAVLEHASKSIERAIFPNGVSNYSRYNLSLSNEFKAVVTDCVDEFLEGIKGDIIQATAEQIADKLCRSTKFKDSVIKATEKTAGHSETIYGYIGKISNRE